MSTVSVPNTFVNGAVNDGSEVSTNFTELVTYINDNVIVKDGSKAMAGQLSLWADPTADAHAARKAYVDGKVGFKSNWTTASDTFTANDTYENIGSGLSFTAPSVAVTIQAFAYCTHVGGAGTVPYRFRVGINTVNTTTDADYTWSPVSYHTIGSGEYATQYAMLHVGPLTPTAGTVRVKMQHYQTSGAISFGQAAEAGIMYMYQKQVAV